MVCSFNGAEITATSHSSSSWSSRLVSATQSSPACSATRPDPVTATPVQPNARNSFQLHNPMWPNPTKPIRASPKAGGWGSERSYTGVAQIPSRSA